MTATPHPHTPEATLSGEAVVASGQTTGRGSGEAGRARVERDTPRAALAGNTLALSVAAVAFAVAVVLSVAGDVESRSCAVADDPSTCAVQR